MASSVEPLARAQTNALSPERVWADFIKGMHAAGFAAKRGSRAGFHTHVGLDRLWASLGLHAVADGIEFDDAAPLAAVRQALTRPIGA